MHIKISMIFITQFFLRYMNHICKYKYMREVLTCMQLLHLELNDVKSQTTHECNAICTSTFIVSEVWLRRHIEYYIQLMQETVSPSVRIGRFITELVNTAV